MDFHGELPLKDIFENLAVDAYEETSDATAQYNCVAWAAGSTTEWWWPAPAYYWPARVPRAATVDSAIAAFATLGYRPCENADWEPGIEKIAVYGHGDRLTHTARQLEDGHWTSKIGKRIDITHATLECLQGREYGVATCFLSRLRR